MLYRKNTDPSIFVGRRDELALLDRLRDSSSAELLILYGRRRVGKTRLLTYWLDKSNARALFWTAGPHTPADQLRSFSQAIAAFRDPDAPVPPLFTYASWEQAFREIARLSQDERLVLVIDEFTYLLESDPSIAGELQNLWDHVLKHANLFVCITGSHIGMMQRHVLAYQAPLYGRATALLQLLPLWYGSTADYFSRYSAAERVEVYAMVGGIPAYWEIFDQSLSLDANIRQQFLTPNRLLHDEPSLLLQDFINDAPTYVTILRALAYNYRTPKEIADFAGLKQTHVPAYLSKLINVGFVERRLPVTASPNSRKGRHHIVDPFLRFYYRFLSQRQQQISSGVPDKVLAELKRHMSDFIGKHTWEELCREWLLRASVGEHLPFAPDQVGGIWNRDVQIDVAGYNSMERTLILGECKWQNRTKGRNTLVDLIRKTGAVVPKGGNWRIYYLGFSLNGWTEQARAFTEDPENFNAGGDNWQAVGMGLYDLEDIDRDLVEWTG